MKKKLSIRFVLSMLLAAIMFCMPVGAFMMNAENMVTAFAQDTEKQPEETTTVAPEKEPEIETPGGETESTEGTEETEGTVSGNDAKPVCICTEKCSIYKRNTECEVCKEDYLQCTYIEPNVKITIRKPSGWYRDSVKVSVVVEDTKDSGNFNIQTVEAKIAQNGSWTDITEDMNIRISENSSVYVRVTDQKGKTYEKNRSISCFDTTKPTLNAAVSEGMLSIKAQDSDSGVAAIYVNGYEFTDITNETLNVRLQQFDSGYQNFTIQAMDEAGNMSDIYKTANPYYTDPEQESDSTEENPAGQLPVNAEATPPTNATASVTEHVKTDSEGNKVVTNSSKDVDSEVDQEAGKEFYTIQTASEKVFYLVIDRNGEEEVVYFLTEISENDLLNVTSENSETLPKNSAALESAIPSDDAALSNNNMEIEDTEGAGEEMPEPESVEDTVDTEVDEPESKGENSVASYIFFGVVSVIAVAALYFFKVYRRKGEDFEDDDEDEEEAEESYENEDEEPEADFFEQSDEEEE